MKSKIKFTDEQLTAYLDGEYDYVPKDEVESALKYDADLRAQLDRLSFDRAACSSAFDSLLETSAVGSSHVENKSAKTKKKYFFLWQSAAAVLLVGMGWFGNHTLLKDENFLDDWKAYAAAYQVMYTQETLASLDFSVSQKRESLERVKKHIPLQYSLESAGTVDGLSFERAQVLAYKQSKVVQFAFLLDGITPVALCVTKHQSKVKDNDNFNLEIREGMSSATWVTGGYEFLLIGGSDDAFIQQAANQLKNAFKLQS